MCNFGSFLGGEEFSQKIRLRLGNPEKNTVVTGKEINWAISSTFSAMQEFWLPQFEVLMVPQLHTKYQEKIMSESQEKMLL